MHYDAIIVGWGYAGLSAALCLARARKHVPLPDLDPCGLQNRFASQSHGVFANDGADPGVLLETMRIQVAACPTKSIHHEAAVDVLEQEGTFSVTIWCDDQISSKRLLLAFGISYCLSKTLAISERWGPSVIYCPYCHGYEFKKKKLDDLRASGILHNQAILISEWESTTFYLDEAEFDATLSQRLIERGISVGKGVLRLLSGNGRSLSHIYLSDNKVQPIDALFVSPRNHLSNPIARRLVCLIEYGPLGQTIKVDQSLMTSVRNAYACGGISRLPTIFPLRAPME
ncbi:NAD(P)/FAD-dependent oxidoreductase [Agrobacterium sp. S2]|nr:NAD(P)/FAD-dependent oxidoreductase [Agrobacterium sp. S2]